MLDCAESWHTPGGGLDEDLRSPVDDFLSSVERRGFLPRRLFFAAQRFRRWFRINPGATLHAQASTLHELYETYGLARLSAIYPETRARFFRETVFREEPNLMPGVVHFLDPYRYRSTFHRTNPDIAEEEFSRDYLNHLEEIIQYEGPQTIAAILLETVTEQEWDHHPARGVLAWYARTL